MKVLIPYDGTKAAENALLELQNADFGQTDEIVIVITDIFLPDSAEEFSKARRRRQLKLENSGNCSYIQARRQLEEEKLLSREIHNRMSSEFPAWNVRIETLPGFSLVSSEILAKAARAKPDLIILGLQESEADSTNDAYRSGLWRVVSEAECPVRLARGNNPDNAAEILKRRMTDSVEIIGSSEEKSGRIQKLAARKRNQTRRENKRIASAAGSF